MTFIDVHNHIDFYKDYQIKEIIQRAKNNSVNIIIVNGLNLNSNKKILELSEKYPEIKPSLGLYPTDAINLNKNELEENFQFIKKNKEKIVAIGEIGLDLKEIKSLEKQKKIFIQLLKIAKELNKPVIIHSRKAEKETIEILENEKMQKVIMHCFNGNFKLVKRIIENKWILSIPTNVKNSEHFQKIIEIAPIENLVCETDSPFLHPDKKKNNEPKNIIESYRKISEIKKIPLNIVENKIYDNYKRIFENKLKFSKNLKS